MNICEGERGRGVIERDYAPLPVTPIYAFLFLSLDTIGIVYRRGIRKPRVGTLSHNVTGIGRWYRKSTTLPPLAYFFYSLPTHHPNCVASLWEGIKKN